MDHSTIISSAEEQLRNYGIFLDGHDKKLTKILNNNQVANKERPLLREPLIQIDYAAQEEEFMLVKLLESERMLNKVLLTFGHLCAEIDDISREAKEMQLKFLFKDEELLVIMQNIVEGENEGELPSRNSSVNNNNNMVMLKMSESMEFLCQMQFLLQRCILLGNNLLHQCGAVLAHEKTSTGVEVKLVHICDYLSNLFMNILIFDEILYRSNFARYWPSYKKTIEAITQSGNSWDNCTTSELNGLRNCLQELDFLFTGCIFRHFLDSTFSIKEKIGPQGVGHLSQQFNEYLKLQLQEIDKTNPSELNAFSDTYNIIKLNAFCVVFHDFCGQVDTKSLKLLIELNGKHQAIMLIGNIPWSSSDFLRKNALTLIKTHEKLLMDFRRQQQLFLQHHGQKLTKDCRLYCSEISLWVLKIEKTLSCGPFELRIEQFKELTTLLVQGMRTSGHLSYLIKGIVNSHENLQIPMTKQTLLSICKLLEMLKMIQLSFNEHATNIAKVIHCILQYFQYKVLQLINACKKKIISSKLRDKSVDALAALKITERCLHGPPSKVRILVAKLAFDASSAKYKILSSEQQERFRNLIKRIELISDLQDNIHEMCDTSFLFWHQSILRAYLKQIVDKKLDFNSFQHLIQASTECGNTLNFLNLKDLNLSNDLQKSTYEIIRSEIISKLCAQIEIFLRLEVHANLQVEKMNPFEQGINDYKELINVCPLQVNGNYVILKDHIENYLSAMFYNLTTISLHDWKTYEEMRHLANYRLLLHPVEDYLPNQTLEQGIDILEIMRKIHIFVSKYVYNMNSQIFVEQQSSNKHLDTIGIRHVANSLRTHGTGVINTTVNFTYQFLRQKFYTFSQFLYDEQIKARLMKELRSFAERKQQDEYPLYPYERADAFNKDIRKLGLANDGQTYMDLFRKVITHVGNAMGYIRLVRSGSIHANYSASLYLPKFDENLKFVSQCKEQQLSDEVQMAAGNVETNIQNLAKSFADNTDYFKLLVEAFQPFFRNPHNLHLRNFYLIVPPLIMNYVEYMLAVKSKINKKDREEAVLFDDGFAVGLTYILKLLNQIGDFNSLEWFSTVRERFEAERRKIKEMLLEINSVANNTAARTNTNTAAKQASENEKLQQTLVLTERRINAHQMEYNLLRYNLCSAKIFFQ
ncbi:WASH complex subunit 4 [Lucilia sericata]|uniref:WASH complex subunit 4 n=1 Tax=Lucilia sericata TaxID=13632 RepID=UPI0018A82938|nr:WASH complex subunit 4 [Lucilia sericata]